MSEPDRKMAPVQGYAAGIPWSLHMEAYNEYVKRYGKQETLITGWCRGGFGTNELDMFIPGWRDKVSEITELRNQITALTTQRDALLAACQEVASVDRSNLSRLDNWDRVADICRSAIAVALPTPTEEGQR